MKTVKCGTNRNNNWRGGRGKLEENVIVPVISYFRLYAKYYISGQRTKTTTERLDSLSGSIRHQHLRPEPYIQICLF